METMSLVSVVILVLAGGDGGGGGVRHPSVGQTIVCDLGPTVGYISLYPLLDRCEAACTASKSLITARYRLTRTSISSTVPTREALGRPVGLMTAWLLNDIHVTPHEHIEPCLCIVAHTELAQWRVHTS